VVLLQICSEALLRFAADKYNVRFTPGRVCEGRSNELRTSFAFYSAAELQEGARRLGAAITAFQEQLQQQA
jgi:DNA-binding transcriptional MocR family regulator